MSSLDYKKTNHKSFSGKTYNRFKIAEFLVCNLINIKNPKLVAIIPEKEDCDPDIQILHAETRELLGYVECMGIDNFKDYMTYKYNDVQIHGRRLAKKYDKPCLFVAYDIVTDSYLMCSQDRLKRACKAPLRHEFKDRLVDGLIVQKQEPIYYLPLETFRKNLDIGAIYEWMVYKSTIDRPIPVKDDSFDFLKKLT